MQSAFTTNTIDLLIAGSWSPAFDLEQLAECHQTCFPPSQTSYIIPYFSRLTHFSLVSGGALSKVHHFDSKAHVEEYIREIGVPATFFMPGFYMSNIPGKSFAPNPENGTYRFALPIPANSPMPLFDTGSDTGKFVKAILLNREKCLGKHVLGATDYYTPEQIVEQFKEVKPKAGRGATYAELPPEVFKGFLGKTGMPELVQEEMLQNMQLMPQFGYYFGASLKETHDVSLSPFVIHALQKLTMYHVARGRRSDNVERIRRQGACMERLGLDETEGLWKHYICPKFRPMG